ncbi:MAG: YpdA family putative bacillithiol disulfide reductase [Acidobacteriota bacterium]|nr:YpdA family putative bacillithiol disulfide reductase [Acidobacteriota bacterium]
MNRAVNHCHALVVGAGPTGLACAIELQQRGVETVVIEKGCVVNSIYHYPSHMTFFTTPELLEIGNIPMTSLNDKPNRTEALKYYRRVADHFHLNVRQYERVERIEGHDGEFSVATKDRDGRIQSYSARKIVLSTGYYDVPNLLNVPGEDLPKVFHYYKEPHPYYNQDVAVIGAKNSAAIAALELHWSGARVTLIHRGPEIHRHVKYWIKPNIENRIKSGEIKAYFDSTIRDIRENSISVSTPEGDVSLRNDFVFALIGYSPDLAFLNAAGITLETRTLRPKTDPKTLESERAGVYLAGVIVAGMHTNEIFIENGRFHGKLIAESIASRMH